MINKISELRIPGWLKSIANNPETASFPLKSILKNSLYYPVCGFDGEPVKSLAENLFSFIYTDDKNTKQGFLEKVNKNNKYCKFENYSPVLIKEIFRDEVVPDNWTSTVNLIGDKELWEWYKRDNLQDFFGYWSVWKRNPSAQSDVGPELFSFLYIGGDISVIYEALYIRNNIKPKFLAIIKKRERIGGPLGSASTSDALFQSVVKKNPAGKPEYLLCGKCNNESLYKPKVESWYEYNKKNNLC